MRSVHAMHLSRDMATESNAQRGPSDTNAPSGSEGQGQGQGQQMSSGEPQAVLPSPRGGRGALGLARRHPALTMAGAATLGLFGGFEVAAGIAIGAAMLALLREGRERAAPGAAATHRVRDRARKRWNDLPQAVRERTRAIVQAARGKPAAQSASTPSAD
jgi:hypothetical protein